ncbi:helix-turn-helix domain-containing protein [Paracoccus sp. SCSIO 75233]|uniref:helix-turn-helix domain-containing protein n=1 Tax=Paracoccus sp. SCSIO 75233 TaxID=3017782 RepID=UPI0034A0013B
MDTQMNTLTPNKAAAKSGISRSSIMRAMKSGKLACFRGNDGRWLIPEDDLNRFAAERLADSPVIDRTPQADTLWTPSDTALKLAAAEATISQLQARLESAEQDRERWRVIAENLADRLPNSRPRRRWWPW